MTQRATSKPIVIIGGGFNGTAAFMALTKKLREANSSQRVILVEQDDVPSKRGSSHGDTRITRFANAEAPYLTATAIRSVEIYEDLKHIFNTSSDIGIQKVVQMLCDNYGGKSTLFRRNGFLTYTPKVSVAQEFHHVKGNSVELAIKYAKQSGVEHEQLDGHQIVERFPGFHIPFEDRDETLGYYEPGSGTLFADRCVHAQLAMGLYYGGEYHSNAHVAGIADVNGEPVVGFTDGTQIEASDVVVAAGAWVNQFLPTDLKNFQSQRQVVGYFRSEQPLLLSDRAPGTPSPSFIIYRRTKAGADAAEYAYGLADMEDSSTNEGFWKVARENGAHVFINDDTLRDVYPGEEDQLFEFARAFAPSIKREGMRSLVCHYTVSPGEHKRPIMAPHPLKRKVFVIAHCDGGGAKHAAANGEAVADYILGNQPLVDFVRDFAWVPVPQDDLDISHFLQNKKLHRPLTPG